MTPASSTAETFNGMTGMDDFNWDLLVSCNMCARQDIKLTGSQETEADFDVENTWLFGNLDNGSSTF